MFFARKAQNNEISVIENWLSSEGLPTHDLNESNIVFLLGELDDKPVAAGGLEIYNDIAVMRGLYVEPDFRGEHLGETLARGLINLADKRGIKYIYTLIDDDHMGYFLAKMRYVPCERDEFIKAVPTSKITNTKPLAKAWKLDLELFFSSTCCSDH